DVGGLESFFDVAHLTVDVDVDVAARLAALSVEHRRPRLHGQLRIEDGGQQLVLDLEGATPCLGRADAVRQHGGHPLAHEADDVVEDVGVVRIYQMIFVSGRAVEPARDILPGVDGDHTRYGQGLLAPDADDARVRVRGTQDLQMQDIGHGDVQGVASAAGDHRLGEGVLDA